VEQKKYTCLVVDDEPIARRIIGHYIDQMPQLELAAEQINALDAIDYLRTNPGIDVLFLDINMPNLSGIQLMKIARPLQPVIFTTAYAEYAVESYELNAVDYLLKPFSFERFTKAIYKAIDVLKNTTNSKEDTVGPKKPVVFIKSNGKNYPVFVDDILYCEAMKNYTMVVLRNEQKLMPLIPLSKLEASLVEAGGNVIQIHRSFLVSIPHITAFTPTMVTIHRFEIPIGVQFRGNFLKTLGVKEQQ